VHDSRLNPYLISFVVIYYENVTFKNRNKRTMQSHLI
jgi:hypothetical protein